MCEFLIIPCSALKFKLCNARTWCIKKLIIPVRIEMASTAIEVKGYSEKEWQIIPKVGTKKKSSTLQGKNVESTIFLSMAFNNYVLLGL